MKIDKYVNSGGEKTTVVLFNNFVRFVCFPFLNVPDIDADSIITVMPTIHDILLGNNITNNSGYQNARGKKLH